MAKYKLSKTKQGSLQLVQKIGKKAELNENEIKLLDEGVISHIMNPHTEVAGTIRYAGDASTTLNLYLAKGVTKHKLYSILAQTVEMVKDLEGHNFNLPNLEMDPRFIFVKEITGELLFVYQPVYCRENTFNLFRFLEQVVAAVKTDDRALKAECNAIRSFLAQPQNYRIMDVEMFILRQYPQIYQEIKRKGIVSSPTESIATGGNKLAAPQQQVTPYQTQTPAQQIPFADETMLLNEEMHLVAQQPQAAGAYIVRQQNGAEFPLNKPEMILGKAMDADVAVPDNKAISRHHARIYNNCGAYFLVDEASKNHTYLNGQMVVNRSGDRLANGDVIRLANEEFQFFIR